MAVVEASESKELQEFIKFEQYQDFQPPWVTKTWTDEDLVLHNAALAKKGLADIFEHVVVDGRNAMKFKGPHAAAYLALNEKLDRESAEFWQSDLGKKIQAQGAACEAKLAAGLDNSDYRGETR